MAYLIDKTALVAEIERRIKEHHSGYLVCLKDLLSFINTLEVKEINSTDAFIEKACEWLKEQDEMVGVSFEEDFIERFKNYIKGE